MNTLRMFIGHLLLLLLSTITLSTSLFTECSSGGATGHNDNIVSVRNTSSPLTRPIVCRAGTHILISDIMFRFVTGTSCDKNLKCGPIVACEYRMSDNCNDTQFLGILKSCTAQRDCILRHNTTSRMSCNGTRRIPNYTTMKYRCEADYLISRRNICSDGVTNGSFSSYISSPVPSRYQNTTCCCNATAVNGIYILYVDSHSVNPHLKLGVHYINNTYTTVSLGGKVGNIHVNASGELHQIQSFGFSWGNLAPVGNMTFLVQIMGNGGISCSSRCYQSSSNQPTVTTASVAHATTSSNSRTPGKTSWKSSALLYGSTAAGCFVFLASVIAIIIWFRRKQNSTKTAAEVIYSRPIRGRTKPDSPSLDGSEVQPDTGNSLYSSPGTGNEYFSAMSDVTATSFTPYFASDLPIGQPGRNELREFSDCKSVHLYDNATVHGSNEDNRVSTSADLKYHMYDNAAFKPTDVLEDSVPSEMYGTRGLTEGQRDEYCYANHTRPTKIMKQVLESPPLLTDTYNAKYPRGSAFTYVSVN